MPEKSGPHFLTFPSLVKTCKGCLAISALQGLEPFASSIVPSANLKMSFLRHLVGHNLWAESIKILRLLDVAACFTFPLSHSWYFHSSQLNRVKTPRAVPDVTRSSKTCVSQSQNGGGCEDGGKCFPTHRAVVVPRPRGTLRRGRKTARGQQV